MYLFTTLPPLPRPSVPPVIPVVGPDTAFTFFFFLNDTPPPEIYTLPLHAALPIKRRMGTGSGWGPVREFRGATRHRRNGNVGYEKERRNARGGGVTPRQTPISILGFHLRHVQPV